MLSYILTIDGASQASRDIMVRVVRALDCEEGGSNNRVAARDLDVDNYCEKDVK